MSGDYRTMHNAKMLMEMQHHTQPMQQMEEDIPTVTTPPDYTSKTHFTAEEVKDSWVPKVSFQIRVINISNLLFFKPTLFYRT